MQGTSDNRSVHLFPGSTAARALAIDEIIYQVFEADRRIEHGEKLRPSDFLRCALVSQAFRKPALQALWREIPSLTDRTKNPLWELLRGSGEAMPKEPATMFLNTILSERTYTDLKRWNRFIEYAGFVREFESTGRYEHDVQEKQLVKVLIEHNDSKSIFPSLQVLRWTPFSNDELDTSYLLLTPTLHTADFNFSYCNPEVEINSRVKNIGDIHTFLTRLHSSSPRLRHLCLNTKLLEPDWLHGLTSEKSSFKYLTKLDLSQSTPVMLEAFRELATMPCMESLRVKVKSDDSKPTLPHTTNIRADRLLSISIEGTWIPLQQIFIALDAPVLESVSCDIICNNPMAADLEDSLLQVTEAIASTGSPVTTDTIYLHIRGPNGCVITKSISLVNLLHPLQNTFRNIKKFALTDCVSEFTMEDDDFRTLTSSWPSLQMFALSHYIVRNRGDRKIPTPKILEFFCNNCRNLRSLTLPYLDLGLKDVPVLNFNPPYPPNSHGLRELIIGQSYEAVNLDKDEAEKWARYIHDLFPRLDLSQDIGKYWFSWGHDDWNMVLTWFNEIFPSTV